MPVQRSQRNQTLSISPEEMEMLRAGLHTPDRALSGEEMSNRVFSGDFFSIAEFLPERSVDLLILDPPYNLDKDFNGFKFSRISDGDYQEYIDRCLQRLLPVLKPSASVYLCGDWHCTAALYAAAGKYLKMNYRQLQSWSLAIMAYHHGAGLVQRAMKRLHTKDPIVIARSFKDPNYLFASRNYLFEFLAMLDTDRMKEAIFKNVDPAPLPASITVSMQVPIAMPDLLKRFQLSESPARILNPHFLEPIWSGKRKIPAHYPIRLAGISLDQFRKAFP